MHKCINIYIIWYDFSEVPWFIQSFTHLLFIVLSVLDGFFCLIFCFFLSLSLYFLCVEAHRALELLEDYHSRLSAPQDRTLRIAIERVIRIFKSRLFQALLGK